MVLASSQAMLSRESNHESWTVQTSSQWDVLGPFPIHAREQQYLSPSFPLNLSQPIDFSASWPSSYADNGQVSWGKANSDSSGNLQVSFPNVRWQSLRDTEGWAALQHHAVLRTTLTVLPPSSNNAAVTKPPRLRVNLIQGSYFTILPEQANGTLPHWYAGNIYNMERAIPRTVELPHPPSTTSSTTYQLFVSGDYEIRLFGDPHVQSSDIPVQKITFNITVEDPTNDIVREEILDVVCDFVDGRAFGDAIGIAFRSISGWWTVNDVQLTSESDNGTLSLALVKPTRIAPTQTRIVPIRISQTRPFTATNLHLALTLTSASTNRVVLITVPVTQLPQWSSSAPLTIKGTYFYASSIATVFTAKPPKFEDLEIPHAPILALHGAGVDVVGQTFWSDALPQKDHSWILMPTGRTSWGLDWHGPSTQDAWASLDALVSIVASNSAWNLWKIDPTLRAVVLGHSNGGQGAWYLASRYPDRVLAVLPAAAYIKSQAYIPLTMSRSAHYIDPSLRAVLESSLTPDDNDLFLSNLADTPVLAIHGGNDENVPVWHTRELVSGLRTWNQNASATFKEDPGESHWYPTVFDNDQVQSFLDRIIEAPVPQSIPRDFTLTVAIPADSGSMHGWQIQRLSVPGRLARLHVKTTENYEVRVTSSNVKSFSVDLRAFIVSALWIDDSRIHLPHVDANNGLMAFEAVDFKVWKVAKQASSLQRSGRVQTILTSEAPLVFVVPDSSTHELSVALRIIHDLQIYHRLDAEILRDTEIPPTVPNGNLVVIGKDVSAKFDIALKPNPGGNLDEPGLGLLFLHPHPTNQNGKMLLMQSTDETGLERAARLFPIRTGIAVPDWIVIGPLADKAGAAGVLSAGVWDSDWSWNPAMSWVY
ncbi:transmembrane protein [Moniliophthora roreri MCA 2997]|uniref:Transmembrane protein n=1 Tax=Moniliophthora roreri (strain MCA 2997) TaxID=1381753 RepID=V2X419_MONRO|nr:transmembrane protein [Moniliophthora roreri MCA 2997]